MIDTRKITEKATPLTFSPHLVEQELSTSIHRYKQGKHILELVRKVAFAIILTPFAGTGLLFVSPALPIVGAILITGLSILALSGDHHPGYYTSAPTYGLVFLITVCANFSLKLAERIYTSKVATIALLANGIIVIPTLVIELMLEGALSLLRKKIHTLKELRACIEKMEGNTPSRPPDNACKILFEMYKNTYIKQLNKGTICILPTKIEKQISLLKPLQSLTYV